MSVHFVDRDQGLLDAVELLKRYVAILKVLQGARVPLGLAEETGVVISGVVVPEEIEKAERTRAVLAFLAEHSESKRCENYHEHLREGLVTALNKLEHRVVRLAEATAGDLASFGDPGTGRHVTKLKAEWHAEDCTL